MDLNKNTTIKDTMINLGEASPGLERTGFLEIEEVRALTPQHRSLKRAKEKPKQSLTIEQILVWADSHYKTIGKWPTHVSGRVLEEPSNTWGAINAALYYGLRGLPGGASLVQLLRERRNVAHPNSKPILIEEQILEWAQNYHNNKGVWPNLSSGSFGLPAGESWGNIDKSLRVGIRGLPGKSSLARLLAHHFGKRNKRALPALTPEDILRWADAHKERCGQWPKTRNGAVIEAPGENWARVDIALKKGTRGLPGGYSLQDLLVTHRGVRKPTRLTIDTILKWADAHYESYGMWPTLKSGEIGAAPRETWIKVHRALECGLRGLEGGSSLAKLLATHRDMRKGKSLPPYTEEQILEWADAFHQRTGKWPNNNCGRILEAPENSWISVQNALNRGLRGLPGGSSLPKLLAAHRGVHNRKGLPHLSAEKILEWADAYYHQTGAWPSVKSPSVPTAPEESWCNINMALYIGTRGLPGGSSLSRLLKERRKPAP